jgi:DNA ligase-1
MPSNTNNFLQFAHVADHVTATTKRLVKAALLGEYFSALDDENLKLAARYFSGRVFSLRDGRTTNIGGAALLNSVAAVSQKDVNELRARLVVRGDFGDVAGEVLASSRYAPQTSGWTLHTLNHALENLAETSGSKKKVELVTDILKRAHPIEAKYIVKLFAGDLRIGLQEGAVEDAIARAASTPVAQVQWANMLLGDIGETAVLARHARLDEARMKLFHPLKFMLASPAADLSEVARQMPEEFAVEDKFDGIRAQAHLQKISGGELAQDELHGEVRGDCRLALFSRTLDEITHSFPDLLPSLAALLETHSSLLLDGEIVPVKLDDETGRVLPFQELQKRLGRKTLSEEILQQLPVAFVAYYVLFADDRVLLEESFRARREVLAKLRAANRFRIAYSSYFTDVMELDDEFDAARARGNEGLMVKDPNSRYKPGRRGKEWLKIKRAFATLDVVVTAVEVGNGRRAKVLSDYTFAVRASETDSTLLNVGKAYSGLTDKEIAALSEWFRAHTIQEFAHGKVRVVEPRIVLEVAFDNVQISARHKSGYALRFPRILRVRDDKPVSEIDTLQTVKRLADQ